MRQGMGDSNTPIDVRHHESEQRFETGEKGSEAVLDYHMSGHDTIVFTHTGVPPELQNQGIGSKLARVGLEYARAQKLTVIPRCPFIHAYMKRHPEYADLLPRR